MASFTRRLKVLNFHVSIKTTSKYMKKIDKELWETIIVGNFISLSITDRTCKLKYRIFE